VRIATVVVAFLIAMHGLVHLMGVALLWKLGEPGKLRYADAVPAAGSAGAYVAGLGWLAAGALLVAASVLLIARRPRWRGVAVAGAVLSGVVISLNPELAVAGLVADAAVLVLVTASWLSARHGAREVAS